MGETKVFSFPDAGGFGGGNGLAAMLPALLQNRGIDPTALMGMMANANGGLIGGRGLDDLIALIIVAGLFGNGNGFGFGGNNGRGDTERQMLMDAIQRNGVDIAQLASAVGCSKDQILAGINTVSTAICNQSAQMGQGFNQVLTAMLQGNNALTAQLAECCCGIKGLVTEQGYQNQLAILNQTNTFQSGINSLAVGQERGFSAMGYALAEQGCQSRQNADANTRAVLAKLDAIEDSRKDRELAEKDRIIATLTARSERQAELAPIYKQLADIACNQPPVKKICCPDQYVPVNTGINAMYGLIPTCGNVFAGFNPFANGAGFTNGF